MKKLHLIFFIFLIGLLNIRVYSQTVPSSCNYTPQVYNLYIDDAKRLALTHILNNNYPDTASVNIPQGYVDTLLNALMAVYNAPLPASYDVTSLYGIHTFPYPEMNRIVVNANGNLSWMQALHDTIIPTGEPSIDSLISTYGLNWYNYYSYSWGHLIYFTSDSALNLYALANNFESITGVNYSEPIGMAGDGNRITATVEDNHVHLIYSVGWDDCPSGCICRHYWEFKAYYDCSVEFISDYGCPIFTTIGLKTNLPGSNLMLYPNPANTELTIKDLPKDTFIEIKDSRGISVASSSSSDKINISSLSDGVYFVHFKYKDKTIVKRFTKIQ